MENLDKVIKEFNDFYDKNYTLREILSNDFYYLLILFHKDNNISYGKRSSSSLGFGTQAFFLGVNSSCKVNPNVMRIINGSPYKADGSFRSDIILVSQDVVDIIHSMYIS